MKRPTPLLVPAAALLTAAGCQAAPAVPPHIVVDHPTVGARLDPATTAPRA